MIRMREKSKNFTVVGTDIDEVRRLNSQSGLSYNQVKQLLSNQFNKKK
ncbi:hypothetical protein J5Y03_17550 [Bacillus sp. RG28]|uniref:DNA mismatch repair protein MutT n=1 Tax=Gottfriedia endophytica TaxID=2820819 RepID=A0A940NQH0_9BACI|nr:hypothetical protein [Gottfriedia endophytica]MBP0726966.1 hypothetical protein [Gottfriedia endophytica]